MSADADLRELICTLAKSLYDRGLTGGSSGNISARTDDGGLLVTPTGSSFGRLDPARLSLFDSKGTHVGGDKPTKEMPLHSAFYETRSTAGAVVHLHSCHAVALSMLEDVEAACYAIEELEDTARLALLTHGLPRRPLSDAQINDIVTRFDVDWE